MSTRLTTNFVEQQQRSQNAAASELTNYPTVLDDGHAGLRAFPEVADNLLDQRVRMQHQEVATHDPLHGISRIGLSYLGFQQRVVSDRAEQSSAIVGDVDLADRAVEQDGNGFADCRGPIDSHRTECHQITNSDSHGRLLEGMSTEAVRCFRVNFDNEKLLPGNMTRTVAKTWEVACKVGVVPI